MPKVKRYGSAVQCRLGIIDRIFNMVLFYIYLLLQKSQVICIKAAFKQKMVFIVSRNTMNWSRHKDFVSIFLGFNNFWSFTKIK